MRLYNADYKAMGVHEELMHSGPWRTRPQPGSSRRRWAEAVGSVRVLGFTTAARTLHGRARCAGGLQFKVVGTWRRLHLARGLRHYPKSGPSLVDHFSQPPQASSTCGGGRSSSHVTLCVRLSSLGLGLGLDEIHVFAMHSHVISLFGQLKYVHQRLWYTKRELISKTM
jgi:hypothetical protein